MSNDDNEKHKRFCRIIYIMYAISLLSLLPDTLASVTGLLAGLVSVVMIYSRRSGMKGTPYESHAQFLIRTFWLGGGALLPIATIIASGLIFVYSDMSSIYNSMEVDEMGIMDVTKNVNEYLMTNKTLLISSLIASFGPVVLWFLWRCIRGFKLAGEGQPVPNPNTWL